MAAQLEHWVPVFLSVVFRDVARGMTSVAFSDVAVDVASLERSGNINRVNEWNNAPVELLEIEQAQSLVCPALQQAPTLHHGEPRTLVYLFLRV